MTELQRGREEGECEAWAEEGPEGNVTSTGREQLSHLVPQRLQLFLPPQVPEDQAGLSHVHSADCREKKRGGCGLGPGRDMPLWGSWASGTAGVGVGLTHRALATCPLACGRHSMLSGLPPKPAA